MVSDLLLICWVYHVYLQCAGITRNLADIWGEATSNLLGLSRNGRKSKRVVVPIKLGMFGRYTVLLSNHHHGSEMVDVIKKNMVQDQTMGCSQCLIVKAVYVSKVDRKYRLNQE